MKVCIDIPGMTEESHVEQMILWGIDLELNFSLYTVRRFGNKVGRNKWVAVWIIEPQDQFMFILKWGAYNNRTKAKVRKEVDF